MESFLPIIEAVFTPVLSAYGFRVAVRTANSDAFPADVAGYENGERKVTITYAPSREAWCDVEIDGYGRPSPVRELFSFVQGVEHKDEFCRATRDPESFRREAERCCEFLIESCADFLSGDISAFRRRYRELFLVKHVEGARENAHMRGLERDVSMYDAWLRDYKRPLPG